MRSRRVFGPVFGTTNATTLVYTVPAGRTARLSFLGVSIQGAGTGQIVLRVNSTTGNVLYWFTGSGINQTFEVGGEVVLNPADSLYVTTPASVAAYVTGMGSLLLGEPA